MKATINNNKFFVAKRFAANAQNNEAFEIIYK